MRTAGAAQQTSVGLARREAHGPPRQTAPQKAVLHPAALNHLGHSASPSGAAIASGVASATPIPQLKLLDRPDAALRSRHDSRRTERYRRHWLKRLIFDGVHFTDLPPLQGGRPKGDQKAGSPATSPMMKRGNVSHD